MTDQDEIPFTECMTAVFGAYGRSLDLGLVSLYFDVLLAYPLEAVEEAMRGHLADPDRGQYFPKPADVVRIIQGGKGSQALAAWDEATRAISRIGGYASVAFEDRLINHVTRQMGGWPTFCEMIDDGMDDEGKFVKGNKPFKRQEFIERYQIALANPPTNPPRTLPGRIEITNERSKWADDPRSLTAREPVAIGPGVERKPLPVPAPMKALPSSTEPRPAARKQIGGMSSLGSALKAGKAELREATGEELTETQRKREEYKRRLEEITGEKVTTGG